MKRFKGTILFMLVLVSCAPSEGAIQTALPKLTVTQSKTSEPSPTPTKQPTLTPTKTKTPTVTPTATIVPQNSILLQRSFEDGALGVWSHLGGHWVVEQESDGNDYLSGSDTADNPNVLFIFYTYQKTRWTDYALETRVKFIEGHTLFILIRFNVGTGENYGVAIDRNLNFGFMRNWLGIGVNTPMTLDQNRWYTIRIEIKGDLLSAYMDNALVQELKVQPRLNDYGGIAYVIGTGKVYLDDIKAWSLK